MKEYKETHQSGHISLENLDMIRELTKNRVCDIGIQISSDGRIWICIDSIAFIRFKPDNKGEK